MFELCKCGSKRHSKNLGNSQLQKDGKGKETACKVERNDAAVMAEFSSPARSQDLEYWMSDLPPHLRDEPLIYLAIPGSHDTMSYGITRSSELAPDAPAELARLFPLFRGTMIRWSRTQVADVAHQLALGIRYLDLRVASKKGTDQFFFTHALYADEVIGQLRQVKEFLDSHPLEVVILDFQHFYGMSQADHDRLIASLLNLFGSKICPYQTKLECVTLNTLNQCGMQVIVVYRNQAVYRSDRFWRPEQMPTLWPEQDTVRGLLRFLGNLRRHPGSGFVHQAVLTPTTSFIVLRWVSNLREQCAVPVEQKVFPALRELAPGQPSARAATVNVVIADFVEMNRAEFTKMVVGLNFKQFGSNTPRTTCRGRATDVYSHNCPRSFY